MPSKEELEIINGASAPTPSAEPTVRLTRGSEVIDVPEAARFDYLAQGYDDSRYAEDAPSGDTGGLLNGILSRGEALDRGATFGVGGLVGSTLAGTTAEMTGYQGPRTTAPGLDAALSDKSNLRIGFEQAETERRQRADDLGLEGLAWELGGGIATSAAAGLAKGGSAAAGLLARTPGAMAERLGTRAAAKILGTEAAELAGAGIAKTIGGRALGGLAEGAVSGALSTATENIDTALANPAEAAQNIALGTLFGGATGTVLGGTFGLVEGVVRSGGQAVLPAIERAGTPRPAVPEMRQVGVPDAIQANAARPMLSAQLPDPKRDFATTMLDRHHAVVGGESKAIEEGARALTNGADEVELLEMAMKEEVGIAQKRLVNELALQQGFADNLSDAADPDDVARLASWNQAADASVAERDAAKAQLDAVAARHQAALDAEASARRVLDEAEYGPAAKAAVPASVKPEDLSGIIPVPARSRDFGTWRADTFDWPDRGGLQVNTGEIDGFATIGRIEVVPTRRRQGIGSKLYAKADEFARERGLKLASDVDRSPDAEAWWKKQVEVGRAEYSEKMNRYVLNSPLTEPLDSAVPVRGDRASFDAAKSELDTARGMEAETRAALEANPQDPKLRDDYGTAQKLLVDAESRFDLASTAAQKTAPAKYKRPSGRELRPLREAMTEAKRAAREAAKELEGVRNLHARAAQAAEAAERQITDGNLVPRRMTKIEVDSRDMYQGMLEAIEEQMRDSGGVEAQNLDNFRARVLSHQQATIDAFRRGDYGVAHNLIDQGLKGAVEDAVRGTKSGQVAEFARLIYKVPQSFLENGQVWGPDIAGRNVLANGTWHNNNVASNDAGFKSLYTTVGEEGVGGWGNRRGANSAAAGALMSKIGEQPAETVEQGLRRALRAKVEDYANRAQAFQSPRGQEIADRMAKLQTHIEDTLDNTALMRRDAAVGREALQNGLALATTGAFAGAVTGNAALGLPFVAARWLLGSVARYRGDLAQRVSKGAAKLVRSGIDGAPRIGRLGNQAGGRYTGKVQREENLKASGGRERAIANAKALTDISSREFGALAKESAQTNAVSPGLGDALMQHKIQVSQYVVDRLPKSPSPAPFSPVPKLTNAAATSLDRILIATGNPMQTFDRIVDGAATAEDLDAMRTLFPGPYKALTDSILAEIDKNPRRVKSARTQQYLSRITGMPLTPALMKLGQSQERARKATQGAEDAGAPEGQGANGSDGVTARAPIQFNADPDVLGTRSDRIMNGM